MQWSSTHALPKQHSKIRCFEQSLFVKSKKRSQLGITSGIFSYNFLLSLTCMDKRYFLESQTFLYEFTIFTLLIYIYANLCTTKTILNCDIEWLILVCFFFEVLSWLFRDFLYRWFYVYLQLLRYRLTDRRRKSFNICALCFVLSL